MVTPLLNDNDITPAVSAIEEGTEPLPPEQPTNSGRHTTSILIHMMQQHRYSADALSTWLDTVKARITTMHNVNIVAALIAGVQGSVLSNTFDVKKTPLEKAAIALAFGGVSIDVITIVLSQLTISTLQDYLDRGTGILVQLRQIESEKTQTPRKGSFETRVHIRARALAEEYQRTISHPWPYSPWVGSAPVIGLLFGILVYIASNICWMKSTQVHQVWIPVVSVAGALFLAFSFDYIRITRWKLD